ncbi:DUF2846 domain-containing protein [Neisseria mucosa]|jgi:hypothetical protein|uniref:DUF2846 domain-containing protein n=1 Tax=Neisseria mucosa TaxID=488 RepID=A0AAW6ZD73_NEIMU|nr:DUF2846 domain-containing protein [Neisseria mucosa]MDK6725314.1 DUF2846 domain-containing protein [Neisseria mucosa]MDK6869747.1 DUF2846 domain-containing protein [Neisseria mucosa]MDK8109309.1 DUF2846 domain-containing protein [Neisseria mucosa]MDK8360898.1 DUF2846 domain-containing protein [Neisseria mucosa]
MKFSMLVAVSTVLMLSACVTSVPMGNADVSSKAKIFAPPSEGKAGLYVYRSGILGGALKKDIWVDGNCLGTSAPNVFFYIEVDGGKEHTVTTASEFSTNSVPLHTEAGKHYFVRQYIKMGAFVGGANVKQVSEAEGKAEVMKLNMAATGQCLKAHP